jgi:hypothetical protein
MYPAGFFHPVLTGMFRGFDMGKSVDIERTRSRRNFTREEDEQLLQLVNQMPENSWRAIAEMFPGRTSRQLRERYLHYLCRSLNLAEWTPAEDALLQEKFEEYGPQWSILKSFFSNRSAMNVKNHWTTMISRQSRKAWESRASTSSRFPLPIAPTPTTTASPTVIPPDSQAASTSASAPEIATATTVTVSLTHESPTIDCLITQPEEEPKDLFDFNMFQHSEFLTSDIFADSFFSYT